MTQTKKLVCATERALNKGIDAHTAKGWEVVDTEVIPRGITGKNTYIANLERHKQ